MEHFNIAIDGPAGAGKVPSQSWLQNAWVLYTLTPGPCTAP